MRRVLKLSAIGLILAAILWGFLFWKGGLADTLGVGISVEVKVDADGKAARQVRIYGPPAVVNQMPHLLGINNEKTWNISQDSVEPGKMLLRMEQELSGKDSSWNLSTVTVESSGGLIHRTVTYVETLPEVELQLPSSSEEKPSPESGFIAEEFQSALRETKDRVLKAVRSFVRSVPVEFTIEMPGNIVNLSSALEQRSQNVAHYKGGYSDLVQIGEFRVVSKSLSPLCGRGALAVVLLLVLGGPGYYFYRRFRVRALSRIDP